MAMVLAVVARLAFAGDAELPAGAELPAAAAAVPGPVDSAPPAGIVLPPVTTHAVDVKVKRRVSVNRRIANDLVRNTMCVLRLTIDENGVPLSALPVNCPLSLVPTTTDVAMRWRFHPVIDPSGVPTNATFDLPFNYKTRHHHGTNVADDTPAVRTAKAMFWGDVQVRRRVDPKYPAEVELGDAASDVTCTVRMHVDETGTPTATDVRGCPVAFARATEAAAMQWRWYPVLENGFPLPVHFDLRFIFRKPE